MQNVVQKIREKISREYSQLKIYALEFVGQEHQISFIKIKVSILLKGIILKK